MFRSVTFILVSLRYIVNSFIKISFFSLHTIYCHALLRYYIYMIGGVPLLSERLHILRTEKKRTQQQVADYLGITRPAYTAYEKGNRNPDYDLLVKLATYFDVSTDYLLGVNNKKNNTKYDPEFEKWLNDPRSKILFKEYNESSEEQKEALLKMWEILKSQGKV